MSKDRWYKEMPYGWKVYFQTMCYLGWFTIFYFGIKFGFYIYTKG